MTNPGAIILSFVAEANWTRSRLQVFLRTLRRVTRKKIGVD